MMTKAWHIPLHTTFSAHEITELFISTSLRSGICNDTATRTYFSKRIHRALKNEYGR